MSNKERVVQLIDEIPEYKLEYVIAYIQGIIAEEHANLPDETVDALRQVKDGELETFNNAEALFNSWES